MMVVQAYMARDPDGELVLEACAGSVAMTQFVAGAIQDPLADWATLEAAGWTVVPVTVTEGPACPHYTKGCAAVDPLARQA